MITNSVGRHLSKVSSRGALSLSRKMAARSLSTLLNRGNPLAKQQQQQRTISMAAEHNQWSGDLSYGSPEADFCASSFKQQSRDKSTMSSSWSHSISFTSPESDFTHAEFPRYYTTKADYVNHIQTDDHLRESMAYAMSFAGAETDFCSSNVMELFDERTKEQLHKSEGQLKVLKHEVPLPDTLQEAFGDPNDPRAMVITKVEPPFQIVDVNDAWVGLCGYSKDESRHKELGELLQGPETDKHAVKDLLMDLLEGKEVETVVTNYTKSGRKFQNRVRAGHLRDAQGHSTHLIGVLQEIHEMPDTFVKKAGMKN